MAVESVARLRFVSIPARKMRRVASLVKGLPVEKAINVLNFTPKVAAGHIAKTLKSAAANALSLQGSSTFRPEDLVVREIRVDDGPSAKRLRFQSMGRVFRYKKRYCHLTVRLVEERKRGAAAPAGAVKKSASSATAKPSAKTTTKKSATAASKTSKTAKAPAKTKKAAGK